jgi:hypothetical protein
VFLYAENNDKNIIKKLEINKNIMNKIKWLWIIWE